MRTGNQFGSDTGISLVASDFPRLAGETARGSGWERYRVFENTRLMAIFPARLKKMSTNKTTICDFGRYVFLCRLCEEGSDPMISPGDDSDTAV